MLIDSLESFYSPTVMLGATGLLLAHLPTEQQLQQLLRKVAALIQPLRIIFSPFLIIFQRVALSSKFLGTAKWQRCNVHVFVCPHRETVFFFIWDKYLFEFPSKHLFFKETRVGSKLKLLQISFNFIITKKIQLHRWLHRNRNCSKLLQMKFQVVCQSTLSYSPRFFCST